MEVITTHTNADFDCLGAMVAAHRLYPQALLAFPGAQERSVREFLTHHPGLSLYFKRLREINIAAVKRLILVDVRQTRRIGPFAEIARRPEVELHIYDHHPDVDGDLRGSVETIKKVGATVSILVEIMQSRDLIPTPDEATAMMLGIYEDTGNLLFPSTTEEDFRAATYLLRHGANLETVANYLGQEMTPDQVELLNTLIKSRFALNVKGIEVSIAQAFFPRFVSDISNLSHKIMEIENLEALIMAVQMKDRIFLIGRSRREEVPMGDILADFGGGGHGQAASAVVKDATMVQVMDRLPKLLNQMVKPSWQARHLMTTPVKYVTAEQPVSQVRQLLTRYNINAAPVVTGDRVVGILTRQIVDKASQHGLGEVPASEFMNREFVSAAPSTPMEALKSLIVEHNQRFVPVLEEGCLIGAITRTDLLRHLVSGHRALPLTGPAMGGPIYFKRQRIERILREQLPERILSLLHQLGAVADTMQCGVYVVGGFVRDLLLRQPNLDIDVVVEGSGISFAETLSRQTGGRVRAHAKFSTAVVVLPDGFKIDVASTRMEYYLHPGALPTVEHASLKLDLYRRDFTINTLAISLNQQYFGVLHDFFGGQEDLKKKSIRVLHNLSFVEDPTRVFRAVRLEQRLGFQIGEQTESLIRSAVRMDFVSHVGGARLWNELAAILREPDPLPALQRLADFDLLRYVHPSLHLTPAVETLFVAATHALHWHELLYTGETVDAWQVYLLCLCDGLTNDEFSEMGTRLLIPSKLSTVLNQARQTAGDLALILCRKHRRGATPKPSELFHWLSPLPTSGLLYLTARIDIEEIRRWISNYLVHLRTMAPDLDGESLKSLGISPGPIYREILDTLRDARLDGKISDRNGEIDLIKRSYLRPLRGGD